MTPAEIALYDPRGRLPRALAAVSRIFRFVYCALRGHPWEILVSYGNCAKCHRCEAFRETDGTVYPPI